METPRPRPFELKPGSKTEQHAMFADAQWLLRAIQLVHRRGMHVEDAARELGLASKPPESEQAQQGEAVGRALATLCNR
jgi:hypothetical protein